MVTLELKCLEGEIHIEGSLSFIAMAIKGKLDDGIDRWIAKLSAALREFTSSEAVAWAGAMGVATFESNLWPGP